MKTIKTEPFCVIGISVRTTNENGQGAIDIGGLWGRFFSEQVLEAIPNKVDNVIYSIYTEYEQDHTRPYTTIIGCRVEHLDEIPSGMKGIRIEGGTYAQLSARGDMQQGFVGSKWYEIWNSDLNRAYTADYEVYGEKAHNPADAEVDFLIAIK